MYFFEIEKSSLTLATFTSDAHATSWSPRQPRSLMAVRLFPRRSLSFLDDRRADGTESLAPYRGGIGHGLARIASGALVEKQVLDIPRANAAAYLMARKLRTIAAFTMQPAE
jgi:hypothetical protein